ncbi:MAG: ferrochelatase [Gammaproteobacteria bacterium]|nr:ferrochelatase [Gammaproteobacteria bacterium]
MAKKKQLHKHGIQQRMGILMVNLGTPDEPSKRAVRKYLAQFLADSRVVEIPKLIWLPILYFFILLTRPKESAKKYKKIWTEQGSPLMHYSRRQAQFVEKVLTNKFNGPINVGMAMRYGNPSIKSELEELQKAGVQRLLVLPLYPQYSATSTAAVFDEVTRVLRKWRRIPEIRFINQYHDHKLYIDALVKSISKHWEDNKPGDILVFSFHGIPQRNFELGDPYFCQCHKTARMVADQLELPDHRWQVVFQSRFGRTKWLQPYCSETLAELPKLGRKSIDIICPGFATDCLETLEEINMENREIFMQAGGQSFNYIPALNDNPSHMQALCTLISQHSFGWPETLQSYDAGKAAVEAKESRERAIALGAEK